MHTTWFSPPVSLAQRLLGLQAEDTEKLGEAAGTRRKPPHVGRTLSSLAAASHAGGKLNIWSKPCAHTPKLGLRPTGAQLCPGRLWASPLGLRPAGGNHQEISKAWGAEEPLTKPQQKQTVLPTSSHRLRCSLHIYNPDSPPERRDSAAPPPLLWDITMSGKSAPLWGMRTISSNFLQDFFLSL